MTLNEPVPDFTLPATGGQQIQLSALRGAPLVLYFYPRDATPGCTDESLQFKASFEEFRTLGCTILGLSRDSIASHERFRAKLELPFHLLSDTEEVVCGLFDVIKEKTLYGKPVRGIERSTFVIDATGILRQEWRKVAVPHHAQAVLDVVKSLSSHS